MNAASALPYSVDVCQSMVEALLQMADNDILQPHIPALAWEWMKKRALFRPESSWSQLGTGEDVVRKVRELGDAGLITSYLLVVWSEKNWLSTKGYKAMLDLIRGELGGIGAVGHRADLIQRLDYILSWLEQDDYWKEWYEEFRKVLLEMDEEATKTLTGMSQSYCPFQSPNICVRRLSLYLHVRPSSSVPIVVCRSPVPLPPICLWVLQFLLYP